MPVTTDLKHAVRRLGQRYSPRLTMALLANRWWLLEPEVRLLPLLGDSTATAVDVGANKGVYMYHLAKVFRQVVAFEPQPALAGYLQRAAPANVTVHGCAVSKSDGEAALMMPGDFDELASLEPHSAPVSAAAYPVKAMTVPLRSLDSFALKDVAFIKVDVEGHEADVIEGARETLGRCQPAVLVEVEERHRDGGIAHIKSLMTGLSYQGYFLDGGRLRPIGEFDAARDQNSASLANSVKIARYINNFLFLPLAAAEARIAVLNCGLAGLR